MVSEGDAGQAYMKGLEIKQWGAGRLVGCVTNCFPAHTLL